MLETVKVFLLPPGLIWLLVTLGLLVGLRWRRWGSSIVVLGAIALYLFSTPFVAGALGRWSQTFPALTDEEVRHSDAEAIVVLAGGSAPFSPEFDGMGVDHITLQRLQYAAHLYKVTHLPILVTGGAAPGDAVALAQIMKTTLENDFGVPVRWVESRAQNTSENAVFAAMLLRDADIRKIFLVTHAAHMPRAVRVFAATGLSIVPAPTIFTAPSRTFPSGYLPRLSALENSYYTLYEWMGGIFYAAKSRAEPTT